MGTALGVALTQPPRLRAGDLRRARVRHGRAVPPADAALPALLRRLPRPGPWMDGFKQFLAFPLYATVVWLLWVLGRQTGVNGMAAVTGGCVLLALGLWCWAREAAAGRCRLRLGALIACSRCSCGAGRCSTSARPALRRNAPGSPTARRASRPCALPARRSSSTSRRTGASPAWPTSAWRWRRSGSGAIRDARHRVPQGRLDPQRSRNSPRCSMPTGAAACRFTCIFRPAEPGAHPAAIAHRNHRAERAERASDRCAISGESVNCRHRGE